MRRVAITGLGVVSALGIGTRALWEALCAGRSGVGRVTRIDPEAIGVPIAAEVRDFDPDIHCAGAPVDQLDRVAQFAVCAAREAVDDAGLALTDEERDRSGVVIGCGGGGLITLDEEHRRVYEQRSRRLRPLTVPRIMANAASSHVGMLHGLRGPTLCISTACASSGHAIGEAFELIAAGRADVMLAGGTEAQITVPVMLAWEALRVLARPAGDPSEACRPFSLNRTGLVIGEGAAVVVLESWDRAVARGARIHAELAGYGATADASHLTHPSVREPARAVQMALDRARLGPGDIDYVNAHGTATRVNDATETRVIKDVFGEHARRLAVSSTKSMHGHAIGASGAIELVATVLAIEHSVAPPTAHYDAPDPECDLDYVPNTARPMPIRAALSNSFAFGGLNAALVVRRS